RLRAGAEPLGRLHRAGRRGGAPLRLFHRRLLRGRGRPAALPRRQALRASLFEPGILPVRHAVADAHLPRDRLVRRAALEPRADAAGVAESDPDLVMLNAERNAPMKT